MTSEGGYSGLLDATREAVDNLPSRFDLVEQFLQQFSSSLDALASDFVLKEEGERILSQANATFTSARDLAQNSLQVR